MTSASGRHEVQLEIVNPSPMSTHSARESEWVKAKVVLPVASGCPRGTGLKRVRVGRHEVQLERVNPSPISTHSARESEWVKTEVKVWKVNEKCILVSQRSSQRIAEEVGDANLDRRWTKDNFKVESVKLGVPRKLLVNRRPGRRLRSSPPFGPLV
uniref:Uncharacterized protein n=1 Tax=Solanum tuberosum TaxID=4113 RepID=M1DDX7_SOLTU